MNLIALILFLACATGILTVSRTWAPVPLLVGCCYMTMGQGIEIGSFSFPVYRMLLAVGVLRIVTKREWISGGLNTVDKLLIWWSAWVFFASFFHNGLSGSGPIYASGAIYNVILFYFLTRVWCRDLNEVSQIVEVVAILLVPVAMEMMLEKATGGNLFSAFGGVPEQSLVREGRIRAQGPFQHPILAGTVGATCVPLFIGILRRNRIVALVGITSALVMVFASASSGPVMSLLFGFGALAMWRFRQLTRLARWGAVCGYLLLLLVMNQAPYYLIARIDISGGSTGWHRAFLIEQTFKHLSEWWLFGTDHTRHWMPNQGIASDPNHTDITNYYIGLGVFGGLPSMLLIIAMMLVCFRWVGVVVRATQGGNPFASFMTWCFGAALFAHAATGISVSYFDQSMIFLWLSIAVISSAYSTMALTGDEDPEFSPFDDTPGPGSATAAWPRPAGVSARSGHRASH